MIRYMSLVLLLGAVLLLQGCTNKMVEQQPVKIETIISKVKIESIVSHKEANWIRVSGHVKNSSEYPVTAIEGKVTLTGDGEIFDTRLIFLLQGNRLEPEQAITFDRTFDYGTREIPQLSAEAEVLKLRVLEKTQ